LKFNLLELDYLLTKAHSQVRSDTTSEILPKKMNGKSHY